MFVHKYMLPGCCKNFQFQAKAVKFVKVLCSCVVKNQVVVELALRSDHDYLVY